MAWGTLTIGALALKETDILQDATNANTGLRAVRLEGRETVPGTTVANMRAKQADVMSTLDRTFPIVFERKTEYNGYYQVTDTNAEVEYWAQEQYGQLRWSLALALIGPDNDVDLESRLATVARLNDFALTGERWHAPASGHYSYQVGTAIPTPLVRAGEGGSVTVYRSIPANTNPLWGCPVSGYGGMRARILDNGIERIGEGILLSTAGWELNNGLVRVRIETSFATTLKVATYTGGAWRERSFDVRTQGVVIQASNMKSATVLRNDPEAVSVRIVAQAVADTSRRILDLTLRRGSRFVEGIVQRPTSGTIDVELDVTEARTDNTASGYIVTTTNDGNGNRWAVGSARTVTALGGGIQKTATTTLDFWVGAEVAGSGAASGDAAVDMRNQYIGAMTEKVGVIRR